MIEISRRTLVVTSGLAALAAITGCVPQEGSPDQSQPPEETPDMTSSAQPSTDANTLLVYFSRPGENYWEGGRRDLEVGNTKQLAEIIAELIDCDVVEILAADGLPVRGENVDAAGADVEALLRANGLM